MSNVGKNPYIGPRTFLKEEGHLFFGREREARDLSALVASEKLVLFYAQSGAGKSSLINTRLIPDLENNHYEVVPVGRVSGDLPKGFEVSNIYTYNLMRSLIQHEIKPDSISDSSLSHFLARLDNDEKGYFYDSNLMVELPEGEGIIPWRRALIIDQFEELFSTHPEAWEKREDFFLQLAQAMEDDPYLWVVLVMREDYIAALDPYAHLLPGGLRVRYYMQRLGWEAALRAVQNPVEKLRPYAPGVAEKLVENLASIKVRKPDGTLDIQPGQYVEPVQLQVVCYSLWENLASTGSQISEDDLREVGDVNQSLEKFYDGRVSAVAKLKNVDERLIREWFNNELITGGIRNLVLQGPNHGTGGLDDNVIQALQGDLVRAEMRAGQIWYELSHDRLIEPVQSSNAKWFAANLSIFQQQAALWVAQGRPDGMLLRGNELEQAKQEAESKTITKDERDFLAACIKAQERERREKRGNRLVRILFILAIIASVVAAGFAVQANNQTHAAQTALNEAESAASTATFSLGEANAAKDQAILAKATAQSARGFIDADRLAGQAQIALGRLDTVSLGQLLAVEAYNLNRQAGEIRPGVYQALYESVEKGQDKILQDGTFSYAQLGSGVNDNWLILDNTLWNLATLRFVRLVETDKILQTAFRPDGQVVIVTGEVGSYSSNAINVYVKDKTNRTKNQFLLTTSDSGRVDNLKISDDGGWIATSYAENSIEGVQLWDVAHSSPVVYLPVPAGIGRVAISPDGSKIAATSNNSILIWQNTGGKLQPVALVPLNYSQYYSYFTDRILRGRSGNLLQFSPDGHWLAVMTTNELVIWGDSIPAPIRVTLQRVDGLMGFLFSPDSNSLVYVTNQYCYYYESECTPNASVSRVLLEKSGNGALQPIIEKSDVSITALDIGQNGKLVIGDETGSIRAWDLNENLSNPLVTTAHAGAVAGIVVAPDNTTIISSGENDDTRIWKLATEQSPAIAVHRSASTILSAIRTPDRKRLVIGGSYSKASKPYVAIDVISNLESPTSANELILSSSAAGSLQAFSISDQWVAAGRVVSTGYSNGEAYFLDLWHLDTGSSTGPAMTVPLSVGVRSLAFNQEGSRIAVASQKNELWVDSIDNIRTGSQTFKSAVERNVFNTAPDAAIMKFGTILPSGLDEIQTLLFAHNDQYLIGASVNGVHIWDLNDQKEYEIQNAIYPIHSSPDQKWLVTAGSNNTLNLYNIESIGTLPILVNINGAVTQFVFSQDGKWLAVATTSGKVLIYEFPMTSDSEPAYSVQGPTSVIGLEFSPNWPAEKWLVAGSGSYAYLWNLNNLNDNSRTATDNPVVLQGHRGNLGYAGFAAAGKWIVTAATDQTIRFWSMDAQDLLLAACRYAGRNLTSTEWRTYFSDDPRQTCEGVDSSVLQEAPTPTVGVTQSPETQIAVYSTPTPTATPSVTFTTYSVKQGDTLSGIAAKYGISLDALIADNGITDPRYISIGQSLRIRVANTAAPP